MWGLVGPDPANSKHLAMGNSDSYFSGEATSMYQFLLECILIF